MLLLAVLPAVVHLPALTGAFRFDPLYIASGLTAGTWHPNGLIPGYPGWIDGNAGVTTEALGALAARDWLAGQVPWWNPYSGIGLPLAAEGQTTALFLPFGLLMALPHGLLLLRMALMVVAGQCTYALLRRLGLGAMPAFVGAALFELNGTFAWLAHGPMMPVAFLPMMLLGAEQGRQRFAIAMAAGMAWSFLAGFPETAALNVLLAASWAALRLVQAPNRVAYAARVGGAAIAGLLIAAPAIWSFLQALPWEFVGSHAGRVQGGLTPGNWAQLLFPYIYGNVMQAPLVLGVKGVLWACTGGYLGLVPVALALLALRRHAPDAALRWLLLGWLVITGLRAAAFGPAVWLFGLVPLLRQAMVHVYILPSWSMALSVLAACTLQDWRHGARLRTGWVLAGTGLAAAAALRAAAPDINGLRVMLPDWVPLAAIVLPALLLTGIVWLLHQSRQRPALLAGGIAGGAACLSTLTLFAGTHGRPLDLGAIQFLQQNTGLGRVLSLGPLVPNFGAMFGIAEIDHNYLPVPSLWVNAIRARLQPDCDGVNFYNGAAPANLSAVLPAYEAMAVRYVLTWPGLNLAATTPGITRAYHGTIMDIWSLPNPSPYVTAPGCNISSTGTGPGTRTRMVAQCPHAATLLRRELYVPGWSVRVNGADAPLVEQDIFQAVDLPAGESSVEFTYAPPGIAWAWLMAGAGVLITVASEGSSSFLKKRTKKLLSISFL